MQPVSQIIERNLLRHAACDNGLWINPEQDDCWQKATEICPSLRLFCQDHGTFRYLEGSGATVEFGAFPEDTNGKYEWIILNLPRQKALLEMMLDCAAALLAQDGTLWLAGENRAGIKSAGKHLKARFGKLRKLDSARHCTLFEAGDIDGKPTFDPAAYRQQWPLDFGAMHMTVTSYPGVFAHGRLDAGTALLLDVLQSLTIEGEVLDFACGTGVIGACIANCHKHANVSLLDNNALALRACKETLDANLLSGTVVASDGLSELQQTYDMMISNPPVHSGVKTDNRLSMRLLDSVRHHINPGGMLIMVANIHLPYESWLTEVFQNYRQLASSDHYKVIMAKV